MDQTHAISAFVFVPVGLFLLPIALNAYIVNFISRSIAGTIPGDPGTTAGKPENKEIKRKNEVEIMRKINYGRYNRQYAVIYIVYMMIGSLFHKCCCKNPATERYLYLHFAEMPGPKELETEDEILQVMDGMNEDFKNKLAGLNCEVTLRKDEGQYRVLFQTGGFEGVAVTVQENGKFHITPEYA